MFFIEINPLNILFVLKVLECKIYVTIKAGQ